MEKNLNKEGLISNNFIAMLNLYRSL